MKKYGVKALSRLSGVSVRTLHHYDQIGLLKPVDRTEAGYRFYGEQELLRLQQILFYKELDFSLKEIRQLLNEPGFNLIGALETHRSALKIRQKRITTLLDTIDQTIQHLKTETAMTNPEMLYEGLPKEVGTTYREEAMHTYGRETVEHSEKELMKLGKAGVERLKKELQEVGNELFMLQTDAPESEKVQQVIARHYDVIRQFWGTFGSEDKQADAYAGLGELYVSDERFTAVDGTPQPEYALFMKQAMRYFADTQLK